MNQGSPTLRLISGVGAKGPACFVVETAGKRLMLDLGEGPPPGYLPDIAGGGPIDALFLSHGHKDHVGGLSLLPSLGNPAIYATDIVARELPNDATVRLLPISGTTEVLGIAVATGRNGHAPGGIWLDFAIGDGLFYSGDFSTESPLYAFDPPAKTSATALLDCSYGDYTEPLAECWNGLLPFVEGGPLLLPVPANGRGPEIALELYRHNFREIFIDDAMRKALRRLCGSAQVSLRGGLGDEIERLAAAAKPIDGVKGVMLAAAADGSSGATARLLAQWERDREPAILFTGYVPPGTPADRLIKSGRAQTLRWNVHPRLSDDAALVRTLKARTVIPAFCDRSKLASLQAAFAPARATMDGPVAL
jgi:Cft2 family RNA processing exonuclease